MTDKERKRRRMEIEKRMRARSSTQRSTRQGAESGSGNLLLFRTYITVILAGAFLVVSFFQTPTSEMVCTTVRQTIAYQIPMAEFARVKEKAISVWNEIDLPMPTIKKQGVSPDQTVYQPDLEESP